MHVTSRVGLDGMAWGHDATGVKSQGKDLLAEHSDYDLCNSKKCYNLSALYDMYY